MTTGRVEARIKIPTGGASVSASTGALASPVTVTVPAGNFYLTAAGGVDSILGELETGLNENVNGYPRTAASLASVIGATTTAGWLFDIASGNDTGTFGGITMTASGSPQYWPSGPASNDRSVRMTLATDNFSAGDNFDVNGTSDLVVAWVGYLEAIPSATRSIVTKYTAGTFDGWFVQVQNTGLLQFGADGTAVSQFLISSGSTMPVGEWHVGIAVIDRSTARARIGVRGLTSGTSSVSAESVALTASTVNAVAMTIGKGGTGADACTEFYYAGLYVGTGSGIATGLSANLSTALTNFASAINAAWSVSLGTDGRVTIANSGWASSLEFTSSDLGTALGFADDEGLEYPDTPAAVTAALGGYGDFTTGAGYLCDEASGSLASAFGTPATLTAVSTPTYSNQGPRGGDDKAVGLDSSADAFNGGASDFDVGTGDLAFVYVARWTGAPAGTGTALSKVAAAVGSGWGVYVATNPSHSLFCVDAGGVKNSDIATTASWYVGEWHIGIGCIDRSTGMMRFGTRGLTSGTSSVAAGTAVSGSVTTAASFSVGASAWVSGITNFQLAALYITTGPSVATGLSANLSSALASFAASMKSQTGTGQAHGVWYPGSPLTCDDHPSMAPEETDARFSESPTGYTLGLSGNVKYVHTNVRWERCQVSQIREAEATFENGSLEVFFRDAITGLGSHPYFGPATPLQIYWNNAGTDTLLGADANDGAGVSGWCVVGVRKFADVARMSQRNWAGQFDVTFPRLVSEG